MMMIVLSGEGIINSKQGFCSLPSFSPSLTALSLSVSFLSIHVCIYIVESGIQVQSETEMGGRRRKSTVAHI